MIAPFSYNASGAVSRVLPGGNDASVDTSRTTSSRVATRDAGATKNASDTTARSTVSRVVSGAPTAASKTQSRTGVVSRAVTQTSGDKRGGLSSAVNTVGRNERVSSASINANPSVRRAGLVLRPSTAEVGGRATIGDSGVQTGSNIDEELRGVKSRAAAAPTAESITQAKERLENTASLNKSCQDQYNECMDQFCAIVDQNQKRCSCSANISSYSKVEEAVKDANAQLNEVAQNIRYVGLSADEIRAILTETEAEIALNGTTDTSANRSMLDDIEDLIRNPTSSASYSSSTNMDFGLDLDLDFSSESADIFSLDFMNMGGSSSVSNLRGADLYNAAKKRCNTVLNQCKEAGGTVKQVTGNYDLLIDKDCIAYEQGLSKMNDTLLSNVRSANLMLQKARLAVLQNKNQYDAKGCVAALETCMTDDMVCGENYFKCVDPTKKYIDENGEVILGQNISKIKDFMEEYNNAGIDKQMLQDTYSNTKISDTFCSDPVASSGGNDGRCVVKYLLNKIGTKARVTDEGLCRAVMEKCQYYSYDKNNNYMPFNDIVVNYIQRAMVNIRAAQYNIISDYASSCMVDVANCYNQQVTQVNSWSSAASINSIYNVMKGACRDVALTCAYAVFDGDSTLCPIGDNDTCINSISDMFYNSMLCGEGEVYVNGQCVNATQREYITLRVAGMSASAAINTMEDDGLGNYKLEVYWYLDKDGKKQYYDLALPTFDEMTGLPKQFKEAVDGKPASGHWYLSWVWVSGKDRRYVQLGTGTSKTDFYWITPVLKSADVKTVMNTTNPTLYLSWMRNLEDCMSGGAKKWTGMGCTSIEIDQDFVWPDDVSTCSDLGLSTCIRRDASGKSTIKIEDSGKTKKWTLETTGGSAAKTKYNCLSYLYATDSVYKALLGNYCTLIFWEASTCDTRGEATYKCTCSGKTYCVSPGYDDATTVLADKTVVVPGILNTFGITGCSCT